MEDWLKVELNNLEIDGNTYAPFVMGILDDESISLDDRITTAMDLICSVFTDINMNEDLKELSKNIRVQLNALKCKRDKDIEEKQLAKAEEQRLKLENESAILEDCRLKREEERKQRKARLKELKKSELYEESSEDEEDTEGTGGDEEATLNNKSHLRERQAEERKKLKEEHEMKVKKDKADLEAQKQAKLDRKERVKTSRKERKRG